MPFTRTELALDLIFKYCPDIPFWPQLPRRSACESMVAQFSENLPCLRYTNEGLIVDQRSSDQELEVFYDRLIAGDLEYFKVSKSYAPGFWDFCDRLKGKEGTRASFLKCHVTGPFTFAASIKDENGDPLLSNRVLMQAVVKGLTMKALWQVKRLREFGRPVIVFIDEPYLGGFGSAYTPVTREDVVKVLAEFTLALKGPQTLTGIHCCGNTDWSMLCEAGGPDIINFDAFGFLDRVVLYAGEVKSFLERGGYLCWGIVPTQGPLPGLNRELLRHKLDSGIEVFRGKGLGKELLEKRLLLSPACGLGSQDAAFAENVFSLLKELSDGLRQSPKNI